MPSLETRRRYRIARRTVGGWVLGALGPGSLRGLARTWKLEQLGRPPATAADQGALICLWHGRMACGLVPFGQSGWSVLVSPSDDGELSRRLLERNGYHVIRGSASRGGARALRAMLAGLGGGARVVVTPDGPRGPRHHVNPGVAWMARQTGLPVHAMGVGCDRAWRLGSWDRFTIPRPRARVVFAWADPIRVAADASEEALAAATDALREALQDAERAAFAHLGREPDW
jgi:lysophospholipid acyltransferase (LPLAT)-like uncharacterized protein